jgi:hypothetical protein
VAESEDKDRSFMRKMTGAALGTAFMVGDAVEAGVSAAVGATKGAVHVADAVTKPMRAPLEAIGVTDMVMAPMAAVTNQVSDTVDNLAERGREGLVEGAGVVAAPITTIVDAVLFYLTDNPAVDALILAQIDKILPLLLTHPGVEALVRVQVEKALLALAENGDLQNLIRAQAHTYLAYLNEHPEELEELIRSQGDAYIDYLNMYPAAVQTLIQGQSIGLAAEGRDEVRERTVTADSVLDLIVRNVLRLKPQDELPVPPEAVRRRAEYGRLPSDYIREYTNGNE